MHSVIIFLPSYFVEGISFFLITFKIVSAKRRKARKTRVNFEIGPNPQPRVRSNSHHWANFAPAESSKLSCASVFCAQIHGSHAAAARIGPCLRFRASWAEDHEPPLAGSAAPLHSWSEFRYRGEIFFILSSTRYFVRVSPWVGFFFSIGPFLSSFLSIFCHVRCFRRRRSGRRGVFSRFSVLNSPFSVFFMCVCHASAAPPNFREPVKFFVPNVGWFKRLFWQWILPSRTFHGSENRCRSRWGKLDTSKFPKSESLSRPSGRGLYL